MKAMPKGRQLITAIVVSYEAREFLPGAMNSLRPTHEAGVLGCIVVDNASRDGSAEYVDREHPWAEIIPSQTNQGFARACNVALSRVSTPYVLFLNPDAEIDPDQLSTLLKFLETHPTAGAAAPAIRNAQGGLQFTQPLPTPLGLLGSAFGFLKPAAAPIEPGSKPLRTEWLCGAVLLFRTNLLRELGGFDPRFFLYFEETDLCHRALGLGAELWAVGESVARHRVGAAAGRTGSALFHGCIARHYFESRFYYLTKHYGWIRAAVTELGELVAMALRAFLARLRGRHHGDFSTRLRAPILSMPRDVSTESRTS